MCAACARKTTPAWAWLHKLRWAMVRLDRDLLGGPGRVLEVDESMVGDVTAGTAGAGSEKVPVMIAVERPGGQRLGRIRMTPTTTPGTLALVDFATTVTTLRDAAAESHLGYYLDESTSRFNRRSSTSRGLLFYRLLEQAVDTSPHPLDALCARAAAT